MDSIEVNCEFRKPPYKVYFTKKKSIRPCTKIRCSKR